MKTGRVTGFAQPGVGLSRRQQCCDCKEKAAYRVFLTDLKVTVYVCQEHSKRYVW